MISLLDQNFSQLNKKLKEINPSKIFILVDENTHEVCLPKLLVNLETECLYEILEIESGEELKTIETATQLWEILAEMEADRKSILLNLGGGVITDLGGFVAATYKRGIPFINIPTTLLSMCDASIGGKTGVDLGFLKNMVGSFTNAKGIFIHPAFLDSLPISQLKSGFAEMLKHGLIADEKHWRDLISIDEISVKNCTPFIERSIQIKQEVVDKDFKEENLRKILNFGHTFGHAFEGLFLQQKKPISHGEAVAIGMICETHLSFLEGLINKETSEKIIENLMKFYPLISIDSFSQNAIFSLMKNDKKNHHNLIHFSLLTSIGSCIYDWKATEINCKKTIDFYKNLSLKK